MALDVLRDDRRRDRASASASAGWRSSTASAVSRLGETSVVIAAAAPHRGAAFDAARYAIEELKARAPIWKAEHFADGSVWIGAPARTSGREQRRSG